MGDGNLSGSHLDAVVQNSPINLLRSGNYNYNSGSIGSRNSSGYYWQPDARSDVTTARVVHFDSTSLHPQGGYSAKGNGFSIRCLGR